jgi:hypothetical protein
MKKWEEFEEYLFERDLLGEDFNHTAVWDEFRPHGRRVTRREATLYIQSYLGAQTRPDSTTLFVLTRIPGTRTKNAMYHVGERTAEARSQGKQWSNDAKRRIDRYTEPTLRRIAEKNPRSLPAARAVAKGIDASLELMAALLDD